MNNYKSFDIGTILTGTTGMSFIDDYSNFYKLVWFIYNNTLINSMGLGVLREDIKNHLLTLYPELETITREDYEKMQAFLSSRDETYNTFLPVTRLGEKLPNKDKWQNDLHEILNDYRYYKNKNKKHH